MDDPKHAAAPGATGANGPSNAACNDSDTILPACTCAITDWAGIGNKLTRQHGFEAPVSFMSPDAYRDLLDMDPCNKSIREVAPLKMPFGELLMRLSRNEMPCAVFWTGECVFRQATENDFVQHNVECLDVTKLSRFMPICLQCESLEAAKLEIERVERYNSPYPGVAAMLPISDGEYYGLFVLCLLDDPMFYGDSSPSWDEIYSSVQQFLSVRCGLPGEELEICVPEVFLSTVVYGKYLNPHVTPLTKQDLIGPSWELVNRHGVYEATLKALQEKISAAKDVHSLVAIAREISITDLRDGHRATFLKNMALIKERENLVLDIRELEKAVSYDPIEVVYRFGSPAWAEGFVFDASDKNGVWVNIKSGIRMSPQAFDKRYAALVITPQQRKDRKTKPKIGATELLIHTGVVPRVDGVRYRPGAICNKDGVFQEAGALYANTYDPTSITERKPKSEWNANDKEAVRRWAHHVDWLLGPEYGNLLLTFIAYVALNLGKRVRWAYLLHGPEGCGKSLMMDALTAIAVGAKNTGKVSNNEVGHATFNEWAEGRVISVVEELFIDGSGKYSVMNTIKTILTDDNIRVHPKGRAAFTVKNVTSYIVNTNLVNPLPLNGGSRRWCVVETRFREKDDYVRDLGGSQACDQYFKDLVQAAECCPGAIREWLLDRDVSDFPEQAPETDPRKELVAASLDSVQVMIKDVLDAENGCPADPRANSLVVHYGHLKEVLVDLYPDEKWNNTRLGKTLREMGYMRAVEGHLTVPLPIQGSAVIRKNSSKIPVDRGRWYLRQTYRGMLNTDGAVRTVQTLIRKWAVSLGRESILSDKNQGDGVHDLQVEP